MKQFTLRVDGLVDLAKLFEVKEASNGDDGDQAQDPDSNRRPASESAARATMAEPGTPACWSPPGVSQMSACRVPVGRRAIPALRRASDVNSDRRRASGQNREARSRT